ncbi:uncharacterized protein Dvar_42800 [Desulfosarcina variabilis str. Montpellier]
MEVNRVIGSGDKGCRLSTVCPVLIQWTEKTGDLGLLSVLALPVMDPDKWIWVCSGEQPINWSN